MREYTCELGGEELTLVANFKASMEIAKRVEDPLAIAREAMVEAYMLADYVPYKPRFAFNIENVPLLLHIGLKAAGSDRSLESVQELVFTSGFAEGRKAAEEYLALIVGPQPQNVEDLVGSFKSGTGESEGNADGPAS